jgi:hypothetical protein
MTFKIGKTSDHASRKVTVLLYGQNGTGKTYFASTFPHPVFLVPAIASNEMKTIAGFDLPVMTFESMDDFKLGLTELGKQVKAKKLDCKTVVVDNCFGFPLTTVTYQQVVFMTACTGAVVSVTSAEGADDFSFDVASRVRRVGL